MSITLLDFLKMTHYTFSSSSVASKRFCFSGLMVEGGGSRSFPPGCEEALPYHIMPTIAIDIPKTTCRLSPSFPKKRKPKIRTRIVFIWPSTWNVTAVNLPMQMNWLRFVPIAIVHDRMMKNCNEKKKHPNYYNGKLLRPKVDVP